MFRVLRYTQYPFPQTRMKKPISFIPKGTTIPTVGTQDFAEWFTITLSAFFTELEERIGKEAVIDNVVLIAGARRRDLEDPKQTDRNTMTCYYSGQSTNTTTVLHNVFNQLLAQQLQHGVPVQKALEALSSIICTGNEASPDFNAI